jgi:hypothetical protein
VNILPYRIKIRLLELNKKQADLIPILAERGIKTNPWELSPAVNGKSLTPKAKMIVKEADRIITEWENERKEKVNACDKVI